MTSAFLYHAYSQFSAYIYPLLSWFKDYSIVDDLLYICILSYPRHTYIPLIACKLFTSILRSILYYDTNYIHTTNHFSAAWHSTMPMHKLLWVADETQRHVRKMTPGSWSLPPTLPHHLQLKCHIQTLQTLGACLLELSWQHSDFNIIVLTGLFMRYWQLQLILLYLHD